MKKLYLLIPAILGLIIIYGNRAIAQDGVNNLGFENWTSTMIGDNLNGWVTLNASKESSDVHSGASALKLETKSSIFGLQPGMATIGKLVNLSAIPGEPYSSVPGSLTGFIKYNLAEGDTALFYIRLTNNGDIIASADTMFGGVQNSWTQFTLNMQWYTWGIPDSIQMGITSGGNSTMIGYEVGTLTAGSWLKADTFSLGDFVSSNSFNRSSDKITIYPNPSKGNLFVNNTRNADIIIYNMLGKKVMEVNNFEADRINLNTLPNGNYVVQINKNNVVSSHKLILTK
ncbi:MAG TPA: T9SS type A sorting domain-containing protein [Bacteroidales bacterium]|nr:T9SS type A sorting domain-containing protein [Bacteroidales bacterium]